MTATIVVWHRLVLSLQRSSNLDLVLVSKIRILSALRWLDDDLLQSLYRLQYFNSMQANFDVQIIFKVLVRDEVDHRPVQSKV